MFSTTTATSLGGSEQSTISYINFFLDYYKIYFRLYTLTPWPGPLRMTIILSGKTILDPSGATCFFSVCLRLSYSHSPCCRDGPSSNPPRAPEIFFDFFSPLPLLCLPHNTYDSYFISKSFTSHPIRPFHNTISTKLFFFFITSGTLFFFFLPVGLKSTVFLCWNEIK